jgi:putative ABC transport system permease protein
MALGASPPQVRRMVVIQGMKVALVGVILGAGPSLALARLTKCMLYGVKSWDPVTIIFVTILLSAVTLLAAYLPARRASRVDPMVALWYE